MRFILFSFLALAVWTGSARAERSYADHGCNVVLRHVWYSSGGRAGWSFVVDVRESFLLARPSEGVGVMWRLQNQAWSYFPLSRYNHPHRIPGYQSYVGYFDHNGHPSMYLDVVALASAQGDRIYDHNFETGDVGFVRADQTNRWDVSPASGRCR